MSLEYVLLWMLRAAAMDAFHRIPFHHSQETEVSRLQMHGYVAQLSGWFRARARDELIAALMHHREARP